MYAEFGRSFSNILLHFFSHVFISVGSTPEPGNSEHILKLFYVFILYLLHTFGNNLCCEEEIIFL